MALALIQLISEQTMPNLLPVLRLKPAALAHLATPRTASRSAWIQALSFLTGGWWEVIVAEAAARSGLFRDLRWSANAGQRGGADMEEDILAVDGVQVVCISCKRGGARAKLLSQLEELNARARSLGGHFTRRFLAVFLPLQGRVGGSVRQRAQELGVHLITPDSLRKSDTFARVRAIT